MKVLLLLINIVLNFLAVQRESTNSLLINYKSEQHLHGSSATRFVLVSWIYCFVAKRNEDYID